MVKKGVLSITVSIILILCSSLAIAQITLSVVNGPGYPGSNEKQIAVSMNNPNEEIQAVQVDICDVDDYLVCTGCELTIRFPGETPFCIAHERDNGCCTVLVHDIEERTLMEVGTGPIVTVSYDISVDAPIGECRELNLEKAQAADESIQPVDATVISGEFCFTSPPPNQTSIPTLSEWGIIIFLTIVMGMGVVTLLVRRIV